MAQELIYTSARQGLQPGSRGFCTVAASAGMPPQIVTLLESLSGYRHVHTPQAAGSEPHPANPVHWSHLRIVAEQSLISRVADAGLDYSGRTNKIAHHLVLSPAERVEAGPAALMKVASLAESWSSEPRMVAKRSLPECHASEGVCRTWQAVAGDAGWAGVLAQSALADRDAYVIFENPIDSLSMVEEALSLLPSELRWRTTFSTYFTGLPPGLKCQWRFVLAGSTEHRTVPPHDRVTKIDLTQLGPLLGEGALIDAARNPNRVQPKPLAIPSIRQSEDRSTFSDSPAAERSTETSADDPLGSELPFQTVGKPSEKLANARSQLNPPVVPPSALRSGNRQPQTTLRWLSMFALLLATVLLIVTAAVAYWWYDRNPSSDTSQSQSIVDSPTDPGLTETTLDALADAKPAMAQPTIPTDDSEVAIETANVPLAEPPSVEEVSALAIMPGNKIRRSKREESGSDTTSASTQNIAVPAAKSSRPIAELYYLLDAKNLKAFQRNGNSWPGNQEPLQYEVSLGSIEGAGLYGWNDGEKRLIRNAEFTCEIGENRSRIVKRSSDPLVPIGTSVAELSASYIRLLPNFVDHIGDQYLIVKSDLGRPLLFTLQGTSEAGTESTIKLLVDRNSSLEEELGNLEPGLLRDASIEIARQPKSWQTVESDSQTRRLRLRSEHGDTTALVDLTIELKVGKEQNPKLVINGSFASRRLETEQLQGEIDQRMANAPKELNERIGSLLRENLEIIVFRNVMLGNQDYRIELKRMRLKVAISLF